MDNGKIENGSSNLTQLQAGNLSAESLLQIILRHQRVILFTTVFFLAVSFFYLLMATPIYTSSSRLYVEQNVPMLVNEFGGTITQSKSYLYTQGELIKSTPIVAEVVDDTRIGKFRTFEGIDNLAGYLKKNLDVTIGRKDDIIKISFDSAYPIEAAEIVNNVVESYFEYHTIRKRSTVSQVRDLFEKAKGASDGELSGKRKELLDFTRENGVVSFDDKGSHTVLQTLVSLSEALTEAQLATINTKADYKTIESMMKEPAKVKQFAAALPSATIRIFMDDIANQLRSELRESEVELENAKYHVTADHPSIKALKTKIDHIKNELNDEVRQFAEAYLEVMHLKLVTAQQREDELVVSFERQRQAAMDLGIKATEYSVLQSELRQMERFSEVLNDRIKNLNITEDARALNITILEAARPALHPSKPQRTKIMAMALVLGLMLGCGMALLSDWLDYRLRSVDEILSVLGIPVLGVIPAMAQEDIIVRHGRKIWLGLKPVLFVFCQKMRNLVFSYSAQNNVQGNDSTLSAADGDNDELKEKPTIIERARKVRSEFKFVSRKAYQAIRLGMYPDVNKAKSDTGAAISSISDDKVSLKKRLVIECGRKVQLEPKSIAAEAYRTVRTALFFGVPKGEAKTILVTSPTPGDGKSTLASNLAIAIAQAGQKTLILDADFRRPVQHNIFEVDNTKGLANVLAGTHSIDEIIHPTTVKGLDIVPCGPEVPNPSEILNSNLFVEILRRFAQRYDRIIIDSPPVTPITDSQILAAICDRTILVLRAEKSTRKESQQARDSLLNVGGRLLGAVVNAVPRRSMRYGYYSGYGHYGGYGYYGYSSKRKTEAEVVKV